MGQRHNIVYVVAKVKGKYSFKNLVYDMPSS